MTNHELTKSLIGDSAVMRALRREIVKIAPAPLSIFIQGPTGAGKELVAQALHKASGCKGRFVPLNVGGLSEAMFADAMFGHRRGAFTNAIESTKGYVQEAENGTLFLDEIGSLLFNNQGVLLRVLEDHTYREVGGTVDRTCEFRVVAANNIPLPHLVQRETFRNDLMYRLQGATITVPALRERREDIPQLVHAFASRLNIWQGDIHFTESALQVLQHQDWPGNVRQLKHAVERAAYTADGPVVDHHTVQMALQANDDALLVSRDRTRREELIALLEQYDGDVKLVAAHYGRTVSTVYRWLQQDGIPTWERQRRPVRLNNADWRPSLTLSR